MLHAKIIDLTKEKIRPENAEEFIASSKFGASIVFYGTVREDNENKNYMNMSSFKYFGVLFCLVMLNIFIYSTMCMDTPFLHQILFGSCIVQFLAFWVTLVWIAAPIGMWLKNTFSKQVMITTFIFAFVEFVFIYIVWVLLWIQANPGEESTTIFGVIA